MPVLYQSMNVILTTACSLPVSNSYSYNHFEFINHNQLRMMSNVYKRSLQLILGAILSLCCLFLQAQRRPVQSNGFVTGKVMIKLKPTASLLLQKNISRLSTNLKTENFSTGILHFDAVARQFKATKMVRVFPNAGRMEARQHKYGLDRWYIVQVDATTPIPTAI